MVRISNFFTDYNNTIHPQFLSLIVYTLYYNRHDGVCKIHNPYIMDDEWLHGFVVLHLMYVRIFNDGWAELEEIKQEKKTMF